MLFEQVGGVVEQSPALDSAAGIPGGLGQGRGHGGGIDRTRARVADLTNLQVRVERRHDRLQLASLPNRRLCTPRPGFELPQPLEQRLAHQRIAQVTAGAVYPPLAEDRVGQRDRRVAPGLERGKLRNRVADQRVDRHLVVGDAIDET